MKSPYDVIKKPIVTEASMQALAQRKYTFEVAVDANKVDIKKAAEEIFGVTVQKVTTMNVKGKYRRQGARGGYTARRKKAIICVTENSKTIEFFDGMM